MTSARNDPHAEGRKDLAYTIGQSKSATQGFRVGAVAAGDKPALRPLAAQRKPATTAEKTTMVLFVISVAAVFLAFQLLGRGPLPVEDDCGASASAGSVQDLGSVSEADETPPPRSAAACGDEGSAESDCDPSPLWGAGQTTAKPEPLSATPSGC